jgi:DNA-binding NarL/FixJ family response regulator
MATPTKLMIVNDNPMVVEGFERIIAASKGRFELYKCFRLAKSAQKHITDLDKPFDHFQGLITEITFFHKSPTFQEAIYKQHGSNITYADVSGLSLIETLRVKDTEKKVKVIIHTEHDRWAYFEKSKNMGLDGYIYENDFHCDCEEEYNGIEEHDYIAFLEKAINEPTLTTSRSIKHRLIQLSETIENKDKALKKLKDGNNKETVQKLQLTPSEELTLAAIAKTCRLILTDPIYSEKLEHALEKKRGSDKFRTLVVKEMMEKKFTRNKIDSIENHINRINLVFGLDFQDKSPNILASVQAIINVAIDFGLNME